MVINTQQLRQLLFESVPYQPKELQNDINKVTDRQLEKYVELLRDYYNGHYVDIGWNRHIENVLLNEDVPESAAFYLGYLRGSKEIKNLIINNG